MKKNEVFTFTAPNGAEVTGVAISIVEKIEDPWETSDIWLCYGQNRLFLYKVGWRDFSDEFHFYPIENFVEFIETIVEYAILPEYDAILENYQHQQDLANDYADKTL